jgi:hypothetical protein
MQLIDLQNGNAEKPAHEVESTILSRAKETSNTRIVDGVNSSGKDNALGNVTRLPQENVSGVCARNECVSES